MLSLAQKLRCGVQISPNGVCGTCGYTHNCEPESHFMPSMQSASAAQPLLQYVSECCASAMHCRPRHCSAREHGQPSSTQSASFTGHGCRLQIPLVAQSTGQS